MKRGKNDSFSLLSQQEIDTLIRFLTDQKNAVDSDILSQTSIDKLIYLMETDKEHLALNVLTYGQLPASLLKQKKFRNSIDEECELQYSVNPDTKFVELSVFNKNTNNTLVITPAMLDEGDTDVWGYSITPVVFTHIAQSLMIKFTQKTYDAVCDTYATLNFGDTEHKIPEIMLPDNDVLLECLY